MPKFSWEKFTEVVPWMIVGGLILAFVWDYHITRSRAYNGQVSYEFLRARYAQTPAPTTPATAPQVPAK